MAATVLRNVGVFLQVASAMHKCIVPQIALCRVVGEKQRVQDENPFLGTQLHCMSKLGLNSKIGVFLPLPQKCLLHLQKILNLKNTH